MAITLTYQEFLDAIDRMREVNFPIERDPAEAWPDFVGWRVNYEQAAYGVAAARRRRSGDCGRARARARATPSRPSARR